MMVVFVRSSLSKVFWAVSSFDWSAQGLETEFIGSRKIDLAMILAYETNSFEVKSEAK